MTADPHDTLDRIARRVPVPEPAYERLLRRQAQREGRGRLSAVAAVIAVAIVCAGIVLGSGRLGRQPAAPTPSPSALPDPVALLPGSYRIDVATGEATPFAPVEGGDEWAPIPSVADGFAFTREDADGRRQLWITSPWLGTLPLTDMAWAGRPVWSPNGQYVAFEGRERGGDPRRRVYVANPGSGDIVALTDSSSTGPTWSRDGSILVASAGGAGRILRVEFDRVAGEHALTVASVTTVRRRAYAPAIAADGRLAYVTSGREAGSLVLVGSDGAPTVLATGRYLGTPIWSPNGTTIAFSADGPDGIETWTVEVATGELHRLSRGRPAAWSGNDALLVDVGLAP